VDRSNLFTLFFAALVCIISSTALTFFTKGLEPYKEANELAYQRKNILIAFNMDAAEIKKLKNDEANHMYAEQVVESVVTRAGVEVPDRTPESVNPDENEADKNLLILYKLKDPATQQIKGYALPIEGKGLWSTLYGYFALENDLNTVMGITFYDHGETPGLGGEIETPWFQNNFKGKKILDNSGQLTSITVIKGRVNELIQDIDAKIHHVDGISGATITSKGVTLMLEKTLEDYEPYFTKLRGEL